MSLFGNLFAKKDNQIHIFSPVQGNVVLASDIPDPTFAENILGPTTAIIPTTGHVYAPFDGTITQIFKTGHALTITSKDGVELLIHVGINTVDLKGEGFKALVADNQEVTKGTPLIDFDINFIMEKGYNIIVPVVICNPTDFTNINFTAPGNVNNETIICSLKGK